MHWELLLDRPSARIRRHGRFLVTDLRLPHLVVSTSARNGGQTDLVRHLVNHQSCEGAGHDTRFRTITEHGQEAYHDLVCGEIGLSAADCAVMGTAANMNYVAIVSERDEEIEVTVAVTAGVQTNAVCAGDPATWRETRTGMAKVPAPVPVPAISTAPVASTAPAVVANGAGAAGAAGAPTVGGTINTILLINAPVAAAALARAVVTMTEGKSAALQRLAVPSRYSADLATGTGTDQFCIAAPIEGEGGRPPLTSTSPHVKLGELIGCATRAATLEALRWQNGLEPSYTRGLFHALGRYGLKEATVLEDLAGLLDASDLELLRRNREPVFYEPMVGAAAHALAAVLDRVRHGTLPGSVMPDAVLQQAAMLAAALAAQPQRWAEFRARLHDAALAASLSTGSPGAFAAGLGSFEPKPLVLAALALGWSEKWRQS